MSDDNVDIILTHESKASQHDDVMPIPVHVKHDDTKGVERVAPQFGTPISVVLAGTEGTTQLTPFEPKRNRTIVWVTAGQAGNTAGSIMIGSKNRVDNGQGAVLVNGQMLEIQSAPALFYKGDGSHSLTLNYHDERYQNVFGVK